MKDGAPRSTDHCYEPPSYPAPQDRITRLKKGGTTPETILLFTESAAPIGCADVECFEPRLAGRPSRTFWFQDETR